jgi:predicted transposase YdaD
MKTDPLFYRLFQERPATAFELAQRPMPAGCSYSLHAEEVKDTVQRLDGVLIPDCDRPDVPLVFVESQFYADPGFYGRWLSGIFRYLHRHRVERPWWGIVVFPGRTVDVGCTVPYESLLASGQMRRVYLEDLVGEGASASLGRRLARLVVLERGQAAAEARALVVAAAGMNPEERYPFIDLVETIVVYKLKDLSSEEVREMLHLPEGDLKKTRFYQEVFAEGRQEGRAEEAASLVLRQLGRCLGGLSPGQEARIRSLHLERLEALGEALMDFRCAADLDAWLNFP